MRPDRRSGAATGAAKADLRRSLVRARARRAPTRDIADAARTDALLAWLAGLNVSTVAAYESWPSEPGTAALIAALEHRGVRVLVPRLVRDASGGWLPDWTPAGESVSLGAAALAQADAVLVPGLAGTLDGDRLGRGGGWYDRALVHARGPVCLLLDEDEVLLRVPVEPHDRRVDAIATPSGVRACQGRSRGTDYTFQVADR